MISIGETGLWVSSGSIISSSFLKESPMTSDFECVFFIVTLEGKEDKEGNTG